MHIARLAIGRLVASENLKALFAQRGEIGLVVAEPRDDVLHLVSGKLFGRDQPEFTVEEVRRLPDNEDMLRVAGIIEVEIGAGRVIAHERLGREGRFCA